MGDALFTWWMALCAAAVVNILAWGWSARRLARRVAHMPADMRASRWLQLWLSAGYVLGCGFRSIFPMADVPRICLHDNWISRIAVGRTIATVAELCFAMQWALLLREAGAGQGGAAALAGRLIVPVIVAADIFSWSAVLTSNYLFHAIENSLWTLAAGLAIAAFLSLPPRAEARAARFLEAAGVGAGAYVAYMVTVDVPMYLSRWHAETGGDGSPSLAQGLHSVLARCVVEPHWVAWREDALWLTLYFTVAVWVSISLAHAPRLGTSK